MQVKHGTFGQIFYASGTWFHLDTYYMKVEHGFFWTNILVTTFIRLTFIH